MNKRSKPPLRRSLYSAALIALTTLTTTLTTATSAQATTPEQAKVDNVLGNSSELLIRRDGRRESLQTGSVIQRFQDAIITESPHNARALLRFLSSSGDDLNFYIETNPHDSHAIYYFPCQIRGGDAYIGWGLARNSDRGCENGLTVSRGRPTTTSALFDPIATTLKDWQPNLGYSYLEPKSNKGLIAQQSAQKVYYCGATGGSSGFATSTSPASSGGACGEALKQCATQGSGSCQVTSTGFWWNGDTDLQATLACRDGQEFSAMGTGTTLADNIQALLPQARGSECSTFVHKENDFVMFPAPDEIVLAQGDDEILVQTRDIGSAPEVNVLKGAINIRSSAQTGPLLVTKGQRYRHYGKTGEITAFDDESSRQSLNMEVLCSFALVSDIPLEISICREENLMDKEKNLTFCNLVQESGGQEGDRRTIQMSKNKGEIEIEYEMFGVPDRLQIIYEGTEILDTGDVSNSNTLTVPFSGKSGRVEVILTGNQENSGTEWNYLLRCPQ